MTRGINPPLASKYSSPCKGCAKRETGCHGKCKEYNEYRIKENDYRKMKYLEEKWR